MSQQYQFQLHDLVQFSAQQNAIFTITALSNDGTYNIEHRLDNHQVLKYDMVTKEMLRKVNSV